MKNTNKSNFNQQSTLENKNQNSSWRHTSNPAVKALLKHIAAELAEEYLESLNSENLDSSVEQERRVA